MFIIGGLFIYNGKVKSTTFDKRKDRIFIRKTNILCDKKVTSYKISDMKSIRAVQRGMNKGQVNTLHYKIIIEFHSQKPLAILETHNSMRVRKEVFIPKFKIFSCCL